MKYTSRDYLDRMIAVAVEDGSIGEGEVLRILEIHGSNNEGAMVDILSAIWQRRKDRKLLENAQKVYKDYRSDRLDD